MDGMPPLGEQPYDPYAALGLDDLPPDLDPDDDLPQSDELTLRREEREHERHRWLYFLTGDLGKALAPPLPPARPGKIIPFPRRDA